jgi:hypothetical protein
MSLKKASIRAMPDSSWRADQRSRIEQYVAALKPVTGANERKARVPAKSRKRAPTSRASGR